MTDYSVRNKTLNRVNRTYQCAPIRIVLELRAVNTLDAYVLKHLDSNTSFTPILSLYPGFLRFPSTEAIAVLSSQVRFGTRRRNRGISSAGLRREEDCGRAPANGQADRPHSYLEPPPTGCVFHQLPIKPLVPVLSKPMPAGQWSQVAPFCATDLQPK